MISNTTVVTEKKPRTAGNWVSACPRSVLKRGIPNTVSNAVGSKTHSPMSLVTPEEK